MHFWEYLGVWPFSNCRPPGLPPSPPSGRVCQPQKPPLPEMPVGPPGKGPSLDGTMLLNLLVVKLFPPFQFSFSIWETFLTNALSFWKRVLHHKAIPWDPLSSSLSHSLLFFNLDIQVQPKASLSSSKPCLTLSWGRGSITALAREKRTLALRFRTLSRSLRVSELKALYFYTAEPNALLSRCACEQNKMR